MKNICFISICLLFLTSSSISAHNNWRNDSIPPAKADSIREAYWDSLFSLPTVQVIAKYSERLPNGGRIVHVQGNPLAKGRLIGDFMNMIPGVSLFRESVKIEGEECSLVEIDGRITDVKELVSLPLSIIDKIEVNPTKDVEYGIGRGGIIRVTLRKFGGLLGSVRGDLSLGDDDNNDEKVSSHVLYRNGRHSIYNSLSLRNSNQYSRYERTEHIAADLTQITSNANRYKNKNGEFIPSYRYSFSNDTWIDIFSRFRIGTYKNELTSHSDNSILNTLQSQNILNYSGGVSFMKNFSTEGSKRLKRMKHKFSYSGSNSPTDETYRLASVSNAQKKQITNSYLLQSTFDFALPWGQSLKTGYEASFLDDYNTWEGVKNMPSLQLTAIRYKLLHSELNPYAQYTGIFNRLYLSGSVFYHIARHEYKDYLDRANNYTHNTCAPDLSANLNWMIDERRGSNLRIWYDKTQITPNHGLYSPIRYYISESLYTSGNPNLKDQVFHNFGAVYNPTSKWYINYSATYGTRIVQLATHLDTANTDMFCTRPENIGKIWHNNLYIGYSGFIIKNIWSLSQTVWLSHMHEESTGKTTNSSFCNTRIVNNFRVNNMVQLSLLLDGETKRDYLSYEVKPRLQIMPGASLSLLNNQLNIAVNGLLYCGKEKVTFKGDGYNYIRKLTSSQNSINLTISWNFQAGKKIQQIQIDSANEIIRDKPKL